MHLCAEGVGEEAAIWEESFQAARVGAPAVPCGSDDELLHHLLCLWHIWLG